MMTKCVFFSIDFDVCTFNELVCMYTHTHVQSPENNMLFLILHTHTHTCIRESTSKWYYWIIIIIEQKDVDLPLYVFVCTWHYYPLFNFFLLFVCVCLYVAFVGGDNNFYVIWRWKGWCTTLEPPRGWSLYSSSFIKKAFWQTFPCFLVMIMMSWVQYSNVSYK